MKKERMSVVCKPFPKSENFLRVPFSALPSFRGDGGRLHTLYIEEKFLLFFSRA